MSFSHPLQQCLDLFEKLDVPYMIAGSFASNIHGAPRATQDADIVAKITQNSVGVFVSSFDDDFYISEDAVEEALHYQRMFNIIHIPTGFKVDIIVLKQRPFSQSEFARRQQYELFGRLRWFASPEDTIIAKLEWAEVGQSKRQLADAAAIIHLQADKLDWQYLHRWAHEVGVQQTLDSLTGSLPKETSPDIN